MSQQRIKITLLGTGSSGGVPRVGAADAAEIEKLGVTVIDPVAGRRRDGLGNLVHVYAATNPGRSMGHEPQALHDSIVDLSAALGRDTSDLTRAEDALVHIAAVIEDPG